MHCDICGSELIANTNGMTICLGWWKPSPWTPPEKGAELEFDPNANEWQLCTACAVVLESAIRRALAKKEGA